PSEKPCAPPPARVPLRRSGTYEFASDLNCSVQRPRNSCLLEALPALQLPATVSRPQRFLHSEYRAGSSIAQFLKESDSWSRPTNRKPLEVSGLSPDIESASGRHYRDWSDVEPRVPCCCEFAGQGSTAAQWLR